MAKTLWCKTCNSDQPYITHWDTRNRPRAKCKTCKHWLKRLPRKKKKEIARPKLRAYLEKALKGQMNMHNQLPINNFGGRATAFLQIAKPETKDAIINRLLGVLTSDHVLEDIIRIKKEED